MTKEEVLQKVNEFCTEKQYTTATLTDAFKNKFVDHFQQANAEGDINDETVVANLQFALRTAFSSASDLASVKATEYTTKENEYKRQIAELQQKVGQTSTQFEMPKEVQDQLDELKKFKDAQTKQEKLGNILKLAKTNIRQDFHTSFDSFAKDYAVSLEKEDKEQADALVARFKEIFKDSIGDITPKAPVQVQKQESDYIASIPKVKITN